MSEQGPVGNTLHNLIQTLSVKIDSAARYPTYERDAREGGYKDCEELFRELGEAETEAIDKLLGALHEVMSQGEAEARPYH